MSVIGSFEVSGLQAMFEGVRWTGCSLEVRE